MAKQYDAQWSSAHPGLLIILLDQSGSMTLEMKDVNESRTVYATKAVNHVIQSIINKSFAGTKPKNRAFVSVIGYNHNVKNVVSGYIQDLAANPIRTEKVTKQVADGTGGLVATSVEMPVWVDPIDKDGATNMKGAFEMAKEIAKGWMEQNTDPLSPAPVIINISDGIPYYDCKNERDCMSETEAVVKEIQEMGNQDGKILIFNACIDDGRERIFPASEDELDNENGKFLYRISSEIPEGYVGAANKNGLTVKPNSRGCIYAAGAVSLIQLIDFGSSKGQGELRG